MRLYRKGRWRTEKEVMIKVYQRSIHICHFDLNTIDVTDVILSDCDLIGNVNHLLIFRNRENL